MQNVSNQAAVVASISTVAAAGEPAADEEEVAEAAELVVFDDVAVGDVAVDDAALEVAGLDKAVVATGGAALPAVSLDEPQAANRIEPAKILEMAEARFMGDLSGWWAG